MISDDGIIIASKELLELIETSRENKPVDLLKSTDLIVGTSKYKCSLISIKLGEHFLNIAARLDVESCLDILNSGLESAVSIPSILTNQDRTFITSIELEEDMIIKIQASRINN